MKAKECMCNDICFVKSNATVSEVAKLMNDNHVGCIPVCNDQNAVCGIVTDRDIILRTIACDKDCKTTKVSDIMTCNVCTCNENDDMVKAENIMSQNQIRRLPVCDQNNKIVGILTFGDIAQNIEELGQTQICNVVGDICNNNQNKNAE